MKTKFSVHINLLFIVLIIFIFLVPGEILPIKSKYLIQIFFYFILLLITFIGVKYFNKDKIKDFGFTTKTKGGKKPKRNAILIGLLFSIISNMIVFYSIDYSSYLRDYNIIQSITLVLIMAPIVEEIVFRGFIQTLLRIYFLKGETQKIFWLPIIITSTIFGLAHFTAIKQVNLFQTLAIVLTAIIFGLLSGYFKEKYVSLIPSIYMHIAANFVGLFFLLFMFFVSPSQVQKRTSMSQPAYNFDMNDSDAFRNSLNDFSIYEKNTPDSLRGKIQNISIKIFLTVDTSGKIASIKFDTIRNMRSEKIINPDFYKESALTVAQKLPQFTPPLNLRKDTTIVFYVSY